MKQQAIRFRVSVLTLAALCGPPARAQVLQGRSASVLRGYVQPENAEEAHYLPFYELVELQALDPGIKGLALHTSFWGVVDLRDQQDATRLTGDLTALYLDYRFPEEGKLRWLRGLSLTAGRHFVALGPAMMEQVDGGKAHYIHPAGIEAAIFGGMPTGTHFVYQGWPLDQDDYHYGYDWLVGGRLGYLNLGTFSAGASFIHRSYDGGLADNDLGADLSYSPFSWASLTGSGVLNLGTQRLKEIQGGLNLQPLRKLGLKLGYRFSSPDLWIPRSSIFAVFSEESYQEARLDGRWAASRRLSLEAGYGRRFFGASGADNAGADDDTRDGANRALLRAAYRFDHAGATGRLVAEAERVETMTDNAVNRLRLAGQLPLELWHRALLFTVDLDFFGLDEPMRGTRFSFTGGGYLEAPLGDRLRLMIGGAGGASPLFKRHASFMARLTWEFALPADGAAIQIARRRL